VIAILPLSLESFRNHVYRKIILEKMESTAIHFLDGSSLKPCGIAVGARPHVG
jgi:hypothetical protein